MVGEAESGKEALDRVPKAAPDVVLLDILLGAESGIDVCRDLKMANPALRVIFVSAAADGHLFDAVDIADGIIRKTAAPAELIAIIRTVVQGRPAVDKQLRPRLFHCLSE